MSRQSRSNLIVGLLLILIGAFALVSHFIPSLKSVIKIDYAWPMVIVAVGLFLFLLGLISNTPGLAVPACVVSGIGGILYYQNATGNWTSWSYLWTLIPGFVGIGVIISGFLSGEWRPSLRQGINTILTSLFLLFLFWLFLGGSGVSLEYWPALLIIFGLWMLVRQLFRR